MLNKKIREWLIYNPRKNPWNYYKRKKQYSIYFELIRRPTYFLRKLPDFLIIGAAKSGTTSLYRYMIQHPKILSASLKEPRFFDNEFSRGLNWYRAFFPITLFRKSFITGEATSYYLFESEVAHRIKKILPNVKLITILRDPVDRLNSLYNMNRDTKRETLPIEEAIENEEERLNELKKLAQEKKYHLRGYSKLGYSKNYLFFSNYTHLAYKTTGIYYNHLKPFIDVFGKDKIHVLTTEELSKNPSETMKKVFEFLSLPNYEHIEYKKHNVRQYEKMDSKTKDKLKNFFKPYNKKLEEELDIKLNWD